MFLVTAKSGAFWRDAAGAEPAQARPQGHPAARGRRTGSARGPRGRGRPRPAERRRRWRGRLRAEPETRGAARIGGRVVYPRRPRVLHEDRPSARRWRRGSGRAAPGLDSRPGAQARGLGRPAGPLPLRGLLPPRTCLPLVFLVPSLVTLHYNLVTHLPCPRQGPRQPAGEDAVSVCN